MKSHRIKPTLYNGIVMSDKHVAMPVIDDEKTLILEEKSRSKMSKKAKDPKIINKNISHKPIDYEKLNRLYEDFGKRFTPQQEMDAEQAFWLRISNPTSKPSDASPVKIEAPKELPKVSLVNESLKKLKFHLARFDNVVKIRTTPDARTEGEWGFEHTKAIFNNEIISFLKSLKDIFNVFDRDLLNEIMETSEILWGIVKQAKAAQPLDKELDFAVDVTPKNKDKKVRFAEPITSSSNSKQVESSKTSDSNTPVLSSTGLKCSTSKCGSKPTGNKRNDRISRPSSRNIKKKYNNLERL
ncbi:hypothetical protein Tco_0389028 [Tanacetum coccineum]